MDFDRSNGIVEQKFRAVWVTQLLLDKGATDGGCCPSEHSLKFLFSLLRRQRLFPRSVICGANLGSHVSNNIEAVSYTHLRAHETGRNLVCRLLLDKKKTKT